MALDGIFLYHLKNEVAQFAVGARIEKIHQPSKEELLLSLRSREGTKKLVLSCRADSAGIYFTSFSPENPPKPPMLCMLLRKHLTGAKILAVEQDGLERIVKLRLQAVNELGDLVYFSLVAEIMGRYSNIILVDQNGIIVDALRRVDEGRSHIRTVLPGESYTAPPAQDKHNLLTEDIETVRTALLNSGKTPARAFQDMVMGVSPIVCREYENGISLEKIREYALNPKPVVVITEKPLDFCFMPITQYGDLAQIKPFDSFCETLDYFYRERVTADRIRQRSGELFKTISNLQERAFRKAINRQNELKECKDKDKYKTYGDLITAHQYALVKGSSVYEVQNFYDNNTVIKIPADPALTPVQNAQKYYKEYRKKQTAQSVLTGFINDALAEAEYLDSVSDALSRASTDAEITAIKTELADAGYLKQQNKRGKKGQNSLSPLHFESSEGYQIFVGRNNMMNDRLTLKTAADSDMWFHVKDIAGSHVIVKNDGRGFSDTVIREAALLAAHNSKARSSSNVAVDYTAVKNVKKPNGAKPGMVIYENYKTEYVTPNQTELERIKEIV
ncbi:MAG TPA: NFACT family protein [Candidatus Eubacterium faecipullorum]|uniref:Rqc2 homolog RqcH n=1 Tax=Candidatus Eubacterium faecipullorum TaxID=2838571 RepID=A0A9D1REA0_9FIRM|nr:NFACT family protein [Candidatus Eubacterium faecipullorum]